MDFQHLRPPQGTPRRRGRENTAWCAPRRPLAPRFLNGRKREKDAFSRKSAPRDEPGRAFPPGNARFSPALERPGGGASRDRIVHAKRAETTTGRSVYDSRGSPWTKNMPSTKLILTLNMFRHKNWKKGFSVYHSKHDRWWNCRGTRGSYGWQIETPSDQ